MVIAEINGGFGNQLFQYANAWTIAKSTGQELVLDLSMFRYGCGREFQLDQLKIEPYKIKVFYTKRSPNKIVRIAVKGIQEIVKSVRTLGYIKIWDENTYKAPNINTQKDLYVRGYWISYKYFEKYEKEIRDLIQLKNPSSELKRFSADVSSENSVALHIRRGDYEALGWCLSDQYYHEAIDLIERTVSGEKKYYVFSDNIEYAKAFLNNKLDCEKLIFVKDKYKLSDVEEVFAIAACKHQIIANSTFSWWGAWLNNSDNKTVVAPVTAGWDSMKNPPTWKMINC